MAQVILHPREGRTARDYALMYIGLGWKVFPVWGANAGLCDCGREGCDRPGKHPIADFVPGGLNDASKERGDIERWWSVRPSASIGIRTGSESGITVVDADASGGKVGVVNLTTLCAQHSGVPPTFSVNTGGGGIHLYFKYSDALPTGTDVLGKDIDVRNDGGYVIAPPSLHVLGAYRWRQDSAELLELPDWLRAARVGAGANARGPGRPRTRQALRIEKAEAMLSHVDPDNRDIWLKIGLILGRMYVGTPGENEGWALYEAWSARSEKFDENRAENLARMREMFHEQSQTAPRRGGEQLGPGTLIQLAREGGWTPFGDRAAVNYEAGSEALMCSELIRALVADAGRNRFFNVMGEVRDVLRCAINSPHLVQKAMAEGRTLPEVLQVRRTKSATLQCALTEVAVLAMIGKGGEPQALPIADGLVRMMLADRARDFPVLSGVAEWPMVALGGQVLMKSRGYDETTGLYFDIDEGLKLESIDAADAWSFLKGELLADFPFQDDLHCAGALAMLLCFMQRPLMRTCPAFAVVAPQPGTGKSTLVEVASIAVHGFQIPPHGFSLVDEELRKAIHALLLSKIPAVLFDNIGRGTAVASDHLSKLITAETVADRTLGASETSTEVNSLLLCFTGNNIAFVRDMATRVLTIRLNAKLQNPLRRSFRHPDIKAWAAGQRAKVLSALVSIARLADGTRPAGVGSRFEDFDLMIVQPVMGVTGKDIRELNQIEDIDAEEDELTREVLEQLFKWQEQWRGETMNRSGWRAADVVAAISERGMPDVAIALVKQFVGNSRAWEQDPTRAFGNALRAIKDDYKFAPYLLISTVDRNGVARWRIKGEEAS